MNQFSIEDYIKTARYEGPVNAADCARLEGQTLRIYRLMIDGTWRTLEEIQALRIQNIYAAEDAMRREG